MSDKKKLSEYVAELEEVLEELAIKIIRDYEWDSAKYLLENMWDVSEELDYFKTVVEDQEQAEEENKLFAEVDEESRIKQETPTGENK